MYSGLPKFSNRLEPNDIEEVSLMDQKETNITSPQENTKCFEAESPPKMSKLLKKY
jgi:hypothetical protein